MMRIMFLCVLIISVLNNSNAQNKKSKKIQSPVFASVQLDTLFYDKISIRAILIDNDKIWYAGNANRFGYFDLKSNVKFENTIIEDTLSIEFRSIAKTDKYIFILSVANPGLLYQLAKDGKNIKQVYRENHEKVFYDSMQFWNNKEGIAIGDPTSNCLSVLITRDGGESWSKMEDDKLPKIHEGEAHFAASNTNIVVKGNNTWVVSGGKKARVFFSSDKGNTWSVSETPIVQGKQMTGIFTADFYDSKNGFIAGGNYEVLTQNFDNKAITIDGGKSWKSIANNVGFGYASCVQYVPKSGAKGIVVVGASGLHYSSDGGLSWNQFLSDPSLYTIRFISDTVAIAAGRNKMIRIHFN